MRLSCALSRATYLEKDGELYLPAALQHREEHAAGGEFVTTAGSSSGRLIKLIKFNVAIKML